VVRWCREPWAKGCQGDVEAWGPARCGGPVRGAGEMLRWGEAMEQRSSQHLAVGNPGLWHNGTTQLQRLVNAV